MPPTSKLLCLLWMLFFSTLANATRYYFSSSQGDDSRSAAEAQNPATPWKSIAKVNAIFSTLSAGDVILFKRGDVFTGTIFAAASGSPGNPIVLEAYGTGNKPVISGLTSLSGWTAAGSNIWEATLPSGNDGVNVLLLNETIQPLGRYPNPNTPNRGYLTIERFSTNTSISDNGLSGNPSWDGGEVVIRKNRWVLDRNKITRHTGNTIHYASQSGYYPSANYGYFIQNHPRTLDLNGEWYYNSSNKKIGIYSSTGAPSSVQASTVNTLARVHNHNNIRFQDISFKGANANAIEVDNAYGVQLLNCDILFSGANGVLSSSSNNLHVEGCTISYTNNTALELRYSSNAVIKGNKINGTGIFPGMGNGDSGSYEGILMDGDNELIEGNEIDSTGYIPITFRGNVNIIKNNFISNYNFVKDDGGGIYTWNNIAGAAPTFGSKIINNIVINGEGAGAGTDDQGYQAANGIYMDDNTAGVEIRGNTVANCGLFGLYVHNGHELSIEDNTFYNSRSQAVLAHDNYADYAPIRNVNMFNNVFFSKDNSQLLAEFKTPKNDIADFGTFNNNYYCRPTYDSYVINASYQSDGANLDLAEWKALYGKDAASAKSPVAATSYNHIRFEYNATASSKTISLGGGTYIDARNNTHSGSITLTPFSSAVLIKQVLPNTLCAGTGSITREQWNNTQNGDFSIVPWQTAPTKTTILTGALETATLGDAYGSRIRGYICPPQTGNYTFWIAGDDRAELWLSTNDNPATKRKIASVSSWTNFREWDRTGSQKSTSIYLEAGKKYYIEALQKESNGGDHLSVAWQMPNGTLEAPIEGTHLSPNAGTTVGLLDQTISFPPLANATFGTGVITLSASASSALPVSFALVSGPATIAGNQLLPTAPGTISIRATQGGNAVYNPAPVVIQNFVVTPGVQCSATGTILREQWNGINGNDIGQIPLTLVPSSASQLTVFEAPVDISNQYGSRIRGYICPPQTGAYTFFIAGDDATELWLSTDDNPTNKVKIAYGLSWTGFREWTRFSTQKSAFINLEGGKKYYIEALQKEGDGGDHLSVGWQLPTGVFEKPIAGARLSPYIVSATAQNQTISFPAPPGITLGSSPFSLVATASSGLPVSFAIVSGPATLAGNQLTPTGPGTISIKATQGGNATYNAAPEVIQNLIVSGGPQCAATGSILREQWNGVGGNDISQIPLTTQPSSSSQLTIFEGPKDAANQYGSRIRGYICPPQTGAYTFFIAGDDATELWLSTDDNLANKIKIAYSLSWTGFREWTRFSTQKSASINLEGGKKYYIEALQKEGDGGDHLSVGWQLPTGVFETPIAGSRLSPYIISATSQNQTISFSAPLNLALGSVPVTLSATASSGLPVSFTLLSGPATLVGNLLTTTGAGTIIIEASQSGSAMYNAAPDVTRSVSVTAPALCSATGTILREQWNGINGNDIGQIPQSLLPSSSSQLSFFEAPKDVTDNYGSRIRGYICPPQTGNYTFWIAGDDATELWLSSNNQALDKVKIAYSLSWTNFRDWHKFSTQKSVTIYLQAGTKYYIEGLQKEGNGGDHLSVAWQLPDGTMEAPINGTHLSPYLQEEASANRTVALIQQEVSSVETKGDKKIPGIKVYPNPFFHQTTIEVTPAETGIASVVVYDVAGRLIRNLFTGAVQKSSPLQVTLKGEKLLPGIYFIRFTSASGAMHCEAVRN